MRRTTTTFATTAVIGVTALLLSGCSVFGGSDAFGGDEPLPKPTSHSTPSAKADRTGDTDGSDGSVGSTTEVASRQAVPAGTVVATTDAVSKSGDTRIHVEVVARSDGRFDAELSGYRTTEPQPMTIEFRRSAEVRDGWDSAAVGATTWQDDSDVPTTVSLSSAGDSPDWLRDVVLVPAPSSDGDSDTRPWVGSVLAVGALDWKLPNPYPNLRVVVGSERPGAYGYVFGTDGQQLSAGGTASTYQVAHGDEQTTVAKRFSISVAELRWLNPTMQVRDDGWIYEGTTLNLDPATR